MTKQFVCPLDRKRFNTKASLYSHIESAYPNLLSESMSPARLYFNLKYQKTQGKCVMTGKPTAWNETTERYERFADEAAKQAYREMFKSRMLSKFGKTHILDDDEQQRKMLNARSITKDYQWADGSITKATGKNEEDFLKMLDSSYGFKASYLAEPPTIYYSIDKGTSSFYLPDFYIPSLNLIVEIKGWNPHYQEKDSYKEELKKAATIKEGFNFIQINDRNYIEFHDFFRRKVREA